jgi:hypothetical protein
LHSEHFACDHPDCTREGLIAFDTQLELTLHRIARHGERGRIEIDFKGPEIEPNWQKEHVNRVRAARRRLTDTMTRTFRGNRKVANEVFKQIECIECRRISASEFVSCLQRECGSEFNCVFCAIAAAIRIPEIRA